MGYRGRDPATRVCNQTPGEFGGEWETAREQAQPPVARARVRIALDRPG